MEKLLKWFPILPEKKDVAKFVWSLIFYVFVPGIAAVLVSFVPFFGAFVAYACQAYGMLGIVFSILGFLGKEIVIKDKQ